MSFKSAAFTRQFELILQALRDAFVSQVPYLVAISAGLLIFNILVIAGYYQQSTPTPLLTTAQSAFPILMVCAVSYHIARVYEINLLAAVVHSLTLFFCAHAFQSDAYLATRVDLLNVILLPIVSTLVLAKIITCFDRAWSPRITINQNLMDAYRYTPAFVLGFTISLIVMLLFDWSMLQLINKLAEVFTPYQWTTEALLLMRTIFAPLLFFFGLHGENMLDLSFGGDYLTNPICQNLTAKTFYDLFVTLGGTGACLALAIAIMRYKKDKHASNLTKISLPFLAFNISEILVYGLPIMLNRKLFFPFIAIPIINFFIAYLCVNVFGLFYFNGKDVAWVTPIFINGFMVTDQGWDVPLLQAVLLLIDVKIYFKFVEKYLKTQSSNEQMLRLGNALNIASSLNLKQESNFREAQSLIISAHIKTSQAVDLVVHNQLELHYQPKIDVQNHTCQQFEALLRLRLKDGSLRDGSFLTTLEQAGLSPIIDLWVCNQVSLDIQKWADQGFHPLVSVNLHPDSLNDRENIEKIIRLLPNQQVGFEILEKAYIENQMAFENIQWLKNAGFALSIDDFGSGYSALCTLSTIPATYIKLDKYLIDKANTEKGQLLYLHVVRLCRDMGFKIVAEGVETEEQFKFMQLAGVDIVQGWYFAKAMPLSEAMAYAKNFH